jgi:arabinan endo-1,5-alpha-L-arabinosidase
MTTRPSAFFPALAALGSILAQFGLAQDRRTPSEAQAILEQHGRRDVPVHDPSSIVKCHGEYWFFATGRGIASWRSADLANWQRGPRVFAEMPAWVTKVVPGQRGHFWAPDGIFHNGCYLLYYSVSRFGVNNSAIALVSNPTLDPDAADYHWTDHGVVVQSGTGDNFNAIDPAVMPAADGRLWMAFGSFWNGIQLIELDPDTGKRIAPDSPMHGLAMGESASEVMYSIHSIISRTLPLPTLPQM